MGVKSVGVVGCGLMGSGIAQIAASKGFVVTVREVNQPLLDKGLKSIEGFLAKGVEKGKVTREEMTSTLSRLKGTTKLEDLADCDIVIEAITENMDLKKETYRTLDAACKKSTIFASNTSSLSVTEMASVTKRPSQFLGMHFFNPVPLMPLLEMVRALQSSDETIATARAFGEALGKQVIVAKDTPGFIVNLLLVPYLVDCVRVLEAGIATKEDIDKGMVLGCGYPMGPFTLLDFVGLDTTLFIADIMFNEFKDPRYAAPPLLRRMVAAGYLGKKSGRGFYDYSQKKVETRP
ncbi:MAG: 3-hydroxybutyryl-CoA dehydrogenase [Planctomycetes bacterium]|nr:3-hydroxybutyryl-CoA dehydrogenase [Planctomycetota bacterium]MBI3846099.1 3-hydroxybutyryl-CoA dehydrogenase [Planctomycetota bacterium]